MRVATVIVANVSRTRFLVQRKDDSYRYPNALALFGGAVEPGESDLDALEREIHEEMGIMSALLLIACGLHEVATVDLSAFDFVDDPEGFTLVLFEAVVDDDVLDDLATRPVFEGRCAEIVEQILLRDDWMPGLFEVICVYVSRCGLRPTPDPRS